MPEPDGPPQAEAGASPAAGGESASSRLRAAFLRPGRRQVVVAVLLAVLGFALVLQVRANDADDSFAGYREQDLIDLLSGLAGATERAESEIDRLEATRDDLRSTTTARETAMEQARNEAQVLAVLAGTVPVSGPGIRVVVDGPDGVLSAGQLVDTVQELRTAGAEAIELNDQVRLVAQSAFESVGGTVEVDGVPLSTPLVIEVIGDPTTLEGGVVFPEGPRDSFEREGASVEVQTAERVEITSVRELPDQEFGETQD